MERMENYCLLKIIFFRSLVFGWQEGATSTEEIQGVLKRPSSPLLLVTIINRSWGQVYRATQGLPSKLPH